jgi:hypothetical protein
VKYCKRLREERIWRKRYLPPKIPSGATFGQAMRLMYQYGIRKYGELIPSELVLLEAGDT